MANVKAVELRAKLNGLLIERVEVFDVDGQSAVSPRQAETIASWIKEDLAAGKLTPEQADKAFADLNTPLEQRAPDTRTDEQKMFDQHFSAAKPDEYRIAYEDPGQEPLSMTSESKQFDTAARTWMSEAGFPRELGNSMSNTIGAVTRATVGKTEAELELYGGTANMRSSTALWRRLGVPNFNRRGRWLPRLRRNSPASKPS